MSEQAKPQARRPHVEDMPEILERIADGLSLRKACGELGIHPGHANAMLLGDERLWAQYMRARALQGDDNGHRVADIAQQVLDKEIPPDVGRVAMQGLQWAASRMNRKLWGDKLSHEHTGAEGGAIRMDLSNLSDEKLEQLEALLAEASQVKPAE